MIVTLRAEARAVNAARYFTGKPCKRGHVAERFTASKTCSTCEANKRASNPGRSTRWFLENRARAIAAHKNWSNCNPGRMVELRKEWERRNPNFRRQWNAKRRDPKAVFHRDDVTVILTVQSGLCAAPWCRKDLVGGFHVDHILPVKLGGKTNIENLQILCPTCNLRKGAKHPDEWIKSCGK